MVPPGRPAGDFEIHPAFASELAEVPAHVREKTLVMMQRYVRGQLRVSDGWDWLRGEGLLELRYETRDSAAWRVLFVHNPGDCPVALTMAKKSKKKLGRHVTQRAKARRDEVL